MFKHKQKLYYAKGIRDNLTGNRTMKILKTSRQYKDDISSVPEGRPCCKCPWHRSFWPSWFKFPHYSVCVISYHDFFCPQSSCTSHTSSCRVVYDLSLFSLRFPFPLTTMPTNEDVKLDVSMARLTKPCSSVVKVDRYLDTSTRTVMFLLGIGWFFSSTRRT